MIIQGSNAPIIIQLEGYESCKVMSVLLFDKLGHTLKQWSKDDIVYNGNIIELPLQESETLNFTIGKHLLEIKYLDEDDNIRFVEPLEVCVALRQDKTHLVGDSNA